MIEDYRKACKRGRREVSDAVAHGRYPYLPALDDILGDSRGAGEIPVGVREIPMELVVGTKTRGRSNVFSSTFLPIADEDTEFATKWSRLYDAQTSEGIRDPVVVYEYLQRFYVQEGNKRVSVLRSLDVPTIMASITRIMPQPSDDLAIRCYYEFTRLYQVAPIYGLVFSEEGSCEKLASLLGQTLDEPWPEDTVRSLKATYHEFVRSYRARGGHMLNQTAADAFLLYVKAYATSGPLGVIPREMDRRVARLWGELVVAAQDDAIAYIDNPSEQMWTKLKGFGDFAQYFPHAWRAVTDNMVREDRYHPCVVGYSTGNEISDINTERGFEVAQELYQRIHELDDTRFVTNGVNGAFAAGEEVADIAVDLTGRPKADFMTGDVNQFMGLMATRMADITRHPVVSRVLERLDSSVDVQGYNYMTARYANDAQKYPQRVMLGTETYPRQVAENWELIKTLPAVIGEFTWTGWDYVGELGDEPYPAWQNTAGDLDTFGFRRPVSYWREIVFGLAIRPYIAVRPPEAHGTPRMFGPWKFTDAVASWTWGVDSGTPMTVEVYAPEGEVELLLNGRLIGRAQTSECYALFEAPYEAGTLEVMTEAGERWALSTADIATAHVVCEDVVCGDWLFSRVHVEDAAGTWVLDSGWSYDCAREGYELVAAGSTVSTPADFRTSNVRLSGQGALAIYRKR